MNHQELYDYAQRLLRLYSGHRMYAWPAPDGVWIVHPRLGRVRCHTRRTVQAAARWGAGCVAGLTDADRVPWEGA